MIMMPLARFYLAVLLTVLALHAHPQDLYSYSVDLTHLEDDRLHVELVVPQDIGDSATFCLPRIVPGIYGAMDHGRLIEKITAFDHVGDTINVERIDTNCWRIDGRAARLIYSVDDGWEEFDQHVKDIEPGDPGYYRSSEGTFKDSVFVINHNAVFGYFRGHEDRAFRISVHLPEGTYAATGLDRNKMNDRTIFIATDYRSLVDAPMLIAPPDTAHIPLRDIDVLVAVHSTSGRPMAHAIAEHIRPLLQDQRDYLGGSLPVDRYTFLLYHHPETRPDSWSGDGLEHSASTLILLHSPTDPEAIKRQVYNIASHEFFHTILPLSVHSEEIANYDFQRPEMSRHLWLYEGMTEYFAMHMPVKQGRIPMENFLDRIAEKIQRMQTFTDTIALTELSLQAMERQDQYYNFYLKGTLFCMGLDIALRKGSNGEKGVVWLVNELRQQFGPERPFRDEELFAVIERITWPAIGEMLREHLDRPGPLPLEEWFAKAGLEFDREKMVVGPIADPDPEQLQLRRWWIGG